MKTALVKRHDFDFPDNEYFFVQTQKDLDEYLRFNKILAANLIRSTTRSSLPIEKFDHMIPASGPERGIAMMALIRAQTNKVGLDSEGRSVFNNPLYQLTSAALEKNRVLQQALDNGDELLITKNGGWMSYSSSCMEILKIYESELAPTKHRVQIRSNSKWIVLENDIELPKESEEFLLKMDRKFSTIYDLRNVDLEHKLRVFRAMNGHTVFVYTTGMDVHQMYNYTKIVAKCGIPNLFFYFVAGTNPEIDEFLKFAKETIPIVKALDHEMILGNKPIV